MNTSSLRILLKIAFTFTGTLIGAGFASGQELFQFFITYGELGIIGILFTGILFAWLSYILLSISSRFQLSTYHDFVKFLCGKTLTPFFEYTLCCFWFTVLAIMLAASGDVAENLLFMEPLPCQIFFCLLILSAAGKGIGGITKINLWVTPFLAVVILAVSINSLQYHNFVIHTPPLTALQDLQPAPHWLLSCLLYASYNLALGAAILVPLGSLTRCNTSLKYGSILGSFLLTCLAFLITIALLIHAPHIIADPLPMLSISCSQNQTHTALYTAAFIIAMFTTATSCLYASATKLSSRLSTPYPICLIFIILAAFSCSDIGFSQLIANLFPFFGYVSLVLFTRMIYKYIYH